MSNQPLTDYEKYIRTEELLALQKAPDRLACHDELQFQIVHQVAELWMKLAEHEALAAARALVEDNAPRAVRLLARMAGALKLLLEQLSMLDTMAPRDYMTIREALGRGSGQESPGFRTLLKMPHLIWQSFKSSYLDRHGQSPSVYGQALAWRDTASGALGVRQTYKDARAFLDFRYVPSPVPEQIGRSNYVDNDRFGIGVGADVLLHLPAAFRPGIQLFADRFIPRHNTKNGSMLVDELPDGAVFSSGSTAAVPGAQGLQTNNPGWPGFSSGGWLWGGSITISVPL